MKTVILLNKLILNIFNKFLDRYKNEVVFYLRGWLFTVAVNKIFQLREVQGLVVYASDEITPTWMKEEGSKF